MRNLKKFLALVLATLMVVSAAATVSAFDDVAEDNQYAAAIDKLVEYGITNGVDESNFAPDNDVERYQMALFMARALKPGETDWSNGMEIFDDVEGYYGAIAFAYTEGIVTGIGNNLFAPHAGIRYQDALIMALRALGYDVDVSGDPYWLAAYTKASEIGLTKNVAVTKGEKTLTRAETAQVIYNMLKAVPADGGATIEEKNFGVMGTDNYTTFVITATEKQAYSESAKAAKTGYVGIQALVNGIPSGDIIYLPVEVFGFEAAEADDYFGYAYDFVNYDAKTGAFDKVVPGLEPVVAYNKDISDKNASKFKFDGEVYYTADAITGAALKNEIVIFNGGAQGVASRMLITNKDGDIVNQNGEVIAAFAYETLTGAKYYYDGKDANGNNSKVVISEATAIDRYGVIIDNDTYVQYQTLKASALTGNYQIKFFDDDRDGKYERAIFTPVYVTVYNNPDNGKQTTPGPWMTGNDDDRKGVTYTDTTLTKGDVFTYTYNTQTKVVNVLEVLDPQYDTLKKINTTGLKDSIVKLTIGDTEYTVGNTTLENNGTTGATLKPTSEAPAKFDDVIKNAKIGYVDYTKLTVGSPIRFIANGNIIIYAETYDIEEVYDLAVLDEITSYDSDAVYANFYLNGKLVKNGAISKIANEDGKTVTLAELNIFQLSKLLGSNSIFNKGNIFRAVPLSDGTYQFSEYFTDNQATRVQLIKDGKTIANEYGLAYLYFQEPGVIKFDDGIADIRGGSNITEYGKEKVLRTDDKTLFYFIERKADSSVKNVTTYVGAPDNSTIDLTRCEVYANKIGYSKLNAKGEEINGIKGVASVVVVYYYTDANNATGITGFGISNVNTSTIYVAGDGKTALNAYNRATAEYFGLDGYTGETFYYYTGDLAINMNTGAKVTSLYSADKLVGGKFYTMSSDGVIIAETTVDYLTGVSKADVDQTRYYTVDGDNADITYSQKVTTLVTTVANSIAIKTDSYDSFKDATTSYKFSYVINSEKGLLVAVLKEDTSSSNPDGSITIVTNAKWYDSIAKANKAANFTYEIKNDKVEGKFMLTNVAFENWTKSITAVKNPFGNGTYTVANVKNGTTTVNVNATCTVKDGNLEVSIAKEAANVFDTTKFDAGKYTAEIHVGTDIIYFGFEVK